MVLKVMFVAIAAASTLLAAGPAVAQPINHRILDALVPDRPSHPEFTDPVSRDSPNAAGRYLALFADLEPDLARAATWAWGDVTLTYGDAPDIANAPMPLEEFRRRLEEAQPWIEQVIEASQMEQFDRRLSGDLFVRPLDESDLRSQFRRGARSTVRVLHSDASRLWEAGEHEAAIDRIAAIIRIGRQLAGDSVDLIDVMVAQALVGLGVDRAMKYLDADPRAATESLHAAADELRPRDPVHTLEMWNNTRAAVAQVAEQALEGEEVGDRLLALLVQTALSYIVAAEFAEMFELAFEGKLEQALDGDPAAEIDLPDLLDDVRTSAEARGLMKPAELRKVLAEGHRLGDQLAEAWYTGEGAARAEALEQRIDEDQTMLLRTMIPISRGLQKSSLRLRGEVDELREAITAPEAEQR